MHAVKVCGQEWKKNCSTAVGTNRRNTLWESWRLWSGDIIWVTGLTEESAPPTVGGLRQPEESSTMIISFSLHNSCSNKMCQVILTKPMISWCLPFDFLSIVIWQRLHSTFVMLFLFGYPVANSPQLGQYQRWRRANVLFPPDSSASIIRIFCITFLYDIVKPKSYSPCMI